MIWWKEKSIEEVTVLVNVVGCWMDWIVRCFPSLSRRRRIRLRNSSTSFHFSSHNDNDSRTKKKIFSIRKRNDRMKMYTWSMLFRWLLSSVDHKDGSRFDSANIDESDRLRCGKGNHDYIEKSKSVERVGVGENNLCTGDRQHNGWDDERKSPSYRLLHSIKTFFPSSSKWNS